MNKLREYLNKKIKETEEHLESNLKEVVKFWKEKKFNSLETVLEHAFLNIRDLSFLIEIKNELELWGLLEKK